MVSSDSLLYRNWSSVNFIPDFSQVTVMRYIGESWRPWQLVETNDGLVFCPRDSFWRTLTPFYVALNSKVLSQVKVPVGVKLVSIEESNNEVVLMHDGQRIKKFGEPVAKHCEMVAQGVYARIFKMLAELWRVPMTVFDPFIVLQKCPSDFDLNNKILNLRLPKEMLFNQSYNDSFLQSCFEDKATEVLYLQHGDIQDPRFYGPHTVPREWWTDEADDLFIWFGPKDKMVLDPTIEIADLLGLACTKEIFLGALSDLEQVWETLAQKSQFVWNETSWFGRALQYNLHKYANAEIVTLSRWVDSGDLMRLVKDYRSQNYLQETFRVIRQYQSGSSQNQSGTISSHKESYAIQLGSVAAARDRIQHLQWVAEQDLASLFT